MQVTQANRGQSRSFSNELLLVLAQLRDVLAAKYSPVVAKKDHDGGTLLPQRAKPNLIAFRVGQDNWRQFVTQGCAHAPHCRLRTRSSQNQADMTLPPAHQTL
jgi:hypothetical protein